MSGTPYRRQLLSKLLQTNELRNAWLEDFDYLHVIVSW